MKIWLKCLIMAWDGILTPVEKRDSLEVCLCGEGYFSSGGNQTRGRGDSCFSCVSFVFFNGCFSFASNILNRYRYIYFRPGNKGFYVEWGYFLVCCSVVFTFELLCQVT